MPRKLTPADNFAFRNAAEVRMAPDGGAMVHLLTTRVLEADRRRTVLMLSRDRQTWVEVAGSEGAAHPRWAPDSRQVAFLRHHGGRHAVVVYDLDRDAATVVVEGAAPLRELAWSPDGRWLAFKQRVDAALPDWLGLSQAPEGAQWAAPVTVTERLIYRQDGIGDLPESSFQIFLVGSDGASAPRALTSGPPELPGLSAASV